MPYNNMISRTEAQALMPEEVSTQLLDKATDQSAALSLFRSVPMSRGQQRLPVVTSLPIAYFVNGDNGLKQTSEVNWDNKFLNAEEVAVILPVPDAVLDDAEFDIWALSEPLVAEAIGRTIDAAIFFGTNTPASWAITGGIVAKAAAAGNSQARGVTTAANGGLAGDISLAFGKVEADGFDVSGAVLSRAYKGLLRNARATDGKKHAEVTPENIYGVAPQYLMRGMWPSGVGAVEGFVGDFSQGLIGRRTDITMKVLTEAVIQDNTGAIIYNLAQQDMTAVRLTIRLAFVVANLINYDQPTEANRYPWCTLLAP